MIDRLHASLTRTVIPLIHCVATDIYLRFTLSNTARKRRQSTADCTLALLAQPRYPATWRHSATCACMWRTWMTSDRRCRFPPTVCLEKAVIPFTSAVFRPATVYQPMGALLSCNVRECWSRILVRTVSETPKGAVATTASHITIPPSTHNTWPVM